MRSPIFDQNHREQETSQRWTLQSNKMLRVVLGPEVLAAQGAMVAYQGTMDFSYQGSKNLSGMLKKAVTGEGGNLMRVTGQGEVFFARAAQNVFLLQLEGDAITVNTRSLLAFDANLGYDIRMIGNAAPCVETMKIEELRALVQTLIDDAGLPKGLYDKSKNAHLYQPDQPIRKSQLASR